MLRDIAQNPDIREGMSRSEIERRSPATATRSCCSTSPTRIRRSSASAGRSRSRASPRTASSRSDDRPDTEDLPASTHSFEDTVLSNLLKAGVQNQVREQRLQFDSLEPFAGEWITARGTFIDTTARRARSACRSDPNTARSAPTRCARRLRRRSRASASTCCWSADSHSTPQAPRPHRSSSPKPGEGGPSPRESASSASCPSCSSA